MVLNEHIEEGLLDVRCLVYDNIVLKMGIDGKVYSSIPLNNKSIILNHADITLSVGDDKLTFRLRTIDDIGSLPKDLLFVQLGGGTLKRLLERNLDEKESKLRFNELRKFLIYGSLFIIHYDYLERFLNSLYELNNKCSISIIVGKYYSDDYNTSDLGEFADNDNIQCI